MIGFATKQERLLYEENKLLKNRIHDLEQLVVFQQNEILALKKRLDKDSSNSSKPSSTDGFKRIVHTRQPTGKKPGGQDGHEDETLMQVEHPDKIISNELTKCQHCGHDLSSYASTIEKRQVFDISEPKLEITEYQTQTKVCPHCKQISQTKFPEEINSPTQYGNKIKTQSIYLKEQQLIPAQRIQEIFQDIYKIHISTGTISNFSEQLSEKLEPFDKHTLKQIEQSKVIHLDETGLKVSKKIHWLHTASNKHFTHYHIAHHLRELKSLIEDKEQWARNMHRLLIYACKLEKVNKKIVKRIESRYDKIVKQGIKYHQNLPSYNKGKAKRPGHNLVLRLLGYKQETLRFLKNPIVPFTNNQAERDIRMTKVKQKISGCFRSKKGAQIFATIRAFISTTKKQGKNVFECLFEAVRGNVPLFYDG
jgi:transposase